MSPVAEPPLLSDEEIERLMVRLAYRAGARGFNAEEAAALVAWARQARLSARMLEQLLAEGGELG
jgi:hypothetical protein